MFRLATALLLVSSLVAADRPLDPEARCTETLPDGRVRTWVPAGWTVVRTNEVQIDERWVAGHWEVQPAPQSATPTATSVTVVRESRRERPCRTWAPIIAPVPVMVWPVGHHHHGWSWSVVVGGHPGCWWRY